MIRQIEKIHRAPTARLINLHVPERPRAAAIGKPGFLDPPKNRIEFRIANVERIVMHSEILPAIIEVHRETLVDANRSKRSHRPVVLQSKQLREELRRSNLVARWNDRVIQCDSHDVPPKSRPASHMGT